VTGRGRRDGRDVEVAAWRDSFARGAGKWVADGRLPGKLWEAIVPYNQEGRDGPEQSLAR